MAQRRPTAVPETRQGALRRLIKRVQRGRARDAGTTPRRGTEVVDTQTGEAHLVREDAMVTGLRSGRYVACCGVEVLAGSLTIPESGSCRACRRWRVGWSR